METTTMMRSAALPIVAASTTTLLLSIALLSQHSHPFTPAHASQESNNNINVDDADATDIITSFDQFPYDENNHLSSHIFAYPAIEPCRSLIENEIINQDLYMHLPLPVNGQVAASLFPFIPVEPTTSIMECPAVCLDRGVDKHLVPHPMPQYYFDPNNNNQDTDHHHGSLPKFLSSHSCGRVEIAVINYHPTELDLYWVDTSQNDKEVYLYKLERMDSNTRFIHTYIAHRFRAKDPNTQEVVSDFTVEFAGTFGIGNHVNPHRDRDIRNQVRRVMDGEWSKKRMVSRTFSPLGFDKGRLPDDLYGSMRSFYYNNREYPHRLMEEWDSKGVYVNYWETDCNFIQIPWTQKKWWQMRLLDVVQEWAGVPIEQTDLYGMRQYTRGARLLTHVDRINTHAVSLIVNIAQGNVTSPWTVEVYDHADRLHEVVMEPGDIVYYESAKALHGRNTPLAGGFYTNLFTHYRPIGDPRWYEKENPPGTPEPLIDVGRCELVGKADEYSKGAVKCENDAIGPHLSPKMFTARSGADLYDLWLSVGPSFEDDAATEQEHEVVPEEKFEEEDEEYDYEDEEEEGHNEEFEEEAEYDDGEEEEEGHDEF